MSIKKILGAWLAMMVLAILNGSFRESVLKRYVDELTAYQLSTVLLLILLTVFMFVFSKKWPFESSKTAFCYGIIWSTMTIAFEFGFGHFIAGHSWEKLLEDYDILAGRIWVLIPVYLAFLPYLVFRIVPKSKL